MSQYAILAGIGVDRPGIVDEVSHFLYERGGGIEDTQLANLRGAASFMLLVSGDDNVFDRIRQDLSQLTVNSCMNVNLLPATELAETAPARGHPYRLLSRGRDQAGVVHRISHLLRVLSVNIENLKIDTPSKHVGAKPDGKINGEDGTAEGFELNLLLSVPPETPVNMLREYLGHLCGEIGISCDLTPV